MNKNLLLSAKNVHKTYLLGKRSLEGQVSVLTFSTAYAHWFPTFPSGCCMRRMSDR